LRILSGIQPSGTIHIGNYFGMVKKMVESQNDGELFAFIASYHALTSVKDKEFLERNIFEAAVNFLALGMDPEKSTFWVQHDVKEVLELYWLLSNHTSMGLLERAHSYKDKTTRGIQANHGLFSYPVLMAADILLFDSNIVPVGKDQIQHVEMTRDIATSFNHTYGDLLVLPESKVDEEIATVPGTDGAKMSKSYNNTIDMFGPAKTIKKQVMGIVTDSKEYATPGEGYGHFKMTLLDKINEHFEPYAQKREHLLNNPKEVKEVLAYGASKARKIAAIKMEIIRDAVGLI
jgi:tryptophanyl-tRNA synthetase